MSVLSRELDTYNRALAAYNRDVRKHNALGKAYNDSIVRDQNGNPVVASGQPGAWGAPQAVDADGRVIGANLISGFNADAYGKTDAGSGYSMLRQNPISSARETKSGVMRGVDEDGTSFYYELGQPDWEGTRQQVRLNGDWQVAKVNPGAQLSYDEVAPTTYDLYRDNNVYPDNPGAWTRKFDMQAPDPSFSQIRKSGQASLAQLEGGLIGEVIAGRGAR